ncbi:unnamed protein product, partial [marine sediment metagenome]
SDFYVQEYTRPEIVAAKQKLAESLRRTKN